MPGARTRIYASMREFINRLSLKYPGKQDTEKRQKLILDMANLVKSKLATHRYKKTWKAWLKEASIQLDSAQIAHREWISRNIWILKDKPAWKPDPPSPREDDIPEDILDLGGEEVAALLEFPSSPPKVPMEVDLGIVKSNPRRSQRKAAKKSLVKEPSRSTGDPKPMERAESSEIVLA
jgi:hypothetical protein